MSPFLRLSGGVGIRRRLESDSDIEPGKRYQT